jgi:hypothetical protein
MNYRTLTPDRDEPLPVTRFRRRMELLALEAGVSEPRPFGEVMVRKWGEMIAVNV